MLEPLIVTAVEHLGLFTMQFPTHCEVVIVICVLVLCTAWLPRSLIMVLVSMWGKLSPRVGCFHSKGLVHP